MYVAKKLGVGYFLTETGDPGDNKNPDAYKLSWMNWSYKLFANITWDHFGFFQYPCDNTV